MKPKTNKPAPKKPAPKPKPKAPPKLRSLREMVRERQKALDEI